MARNIKIELATKDDINVAVAILEEAADWAAAKGVTLWQTKGFERVLLPAAQQGCLYLVKINGQVAATFILQWSDELFWGKQPDDAGYVHKLAVKRDFAGRDVGGEILRWAARKVAEVGRKYLRLDCQADNPTINKYYQKAGFIYQGWRSDNNFSWNLYQKAV